MLPYRRGLAVFLFLLLSGCVRVQPEIKPTASCPKLEMPPVPQKMYLSINGDKIESDAEGESFFRYYVRGRQLLK